MIIRKEAMQTIAIIILIAGFIFMPHAVKAETWSDDFSGATRNTALWGYSHSGDNSYLEQSGGTLNYHNAPPNGDYAVYVSKWTVGFNKNFQFGVDFYNSYAGQSDESWLQGSLDLGLTRFDAGHSSPLVASASATNSGSQKTFSADIGYWDEGTLWSDEGRNPGQRNVDTGRLFIEYVTANDTLKFYAFDSNHNSLGGVQYSGFAKDFGSDPMKVYLGGWGDGRAEFNGKLDNFNGTVTPEPVSIVLFALGAGALGLNKLRRKSKETI